MVTPDHLDDRMALHLLAEHRDLVERLAACEAALREHGSRLEGFDAALAAHAAEPVEVEYVEVEQSPGAEVELTEVEDGAQADITESESEGSGDADAGAA